jgi:hypothetical protein
MASGQLVSEALFSVSPARRSQRLLGFSRNAPPHRQITSSDFLISPKQLFNTTSAGHHHETSPTSTKYVPLSHILESTRSRRCHRLGGSSDWYQLLLHFFIRSFSTHFVCSFVSSSSDMYSSQISPVVIHLFSSSLSWANII